MMNAINREVFFYKNYNQINDIKKKLKLINLRRAEFMNIEKSPLVLTE